MSHLVFKDSQLLQKTQNHNYNNKHSNTSIFIMVLDQVLMPFRLIVLVLLY